jgi:chitodextrinase
MATYGLSLFSKDYYGPDVAVTYSVGSVSAVQTGYGEITLNWTMPSNNQNWSSLQVVRNTNGYPSDEKDGDIILQISPTTPQNSFTDSGLTGGKWYYYAWFVASSFPAYSGAITYQVGDTVSYGGSNWLCVTANTLGITPSVSATQWQVTNATALWNRAGQACSLAVSDYGYRNLLYSLLPAPYATSQQDIASPQDPTNSQLGRYLAVLAYALDMTRTELGEEQHLTRVSSMPIWRMEEVASQLGLDTEASITPRLRRYRVANAVQLARLKGTTTSLRDTIANITGYDSVIAPSTNLMLDPDQTESYSPRYPAWDPSVVYPPGSIVSYSGYLYQAQSSTVRVEAESCTITLSGAPQYIVQQSLPSASYSGGRQVVVDSNAVGQSATFSFTVTTAGTYDVSVGMTRSYDYAQTKFTINGSQVLGSSIFNGGAPVPFIFDGYAPNPSPATGAYLGKWTLNAGANTITVTTNSKNALSGTSRYSNNNGYQMGVDYLTYTPTGSTSNLGATPSGSPTNNAFWIWLTNYATTALVNPLTGGISTWEQVSYTAGVTAANSNLAVSTGVQHLDGQGDFTSSFGVMTNSSASTATLAVHTPPRAQSTAWSSTTTYQRNAYVTYGGNSYLAIVASISAEPDTDLAHWQPETISTVAPDRYMVSSYGIPLAQMPFWSAGAAYQPGAVVQYQGQTYIAASASQGSAPTGNPTDNLSWSWLGSAQNTYTASAWTSLTGGGTTTATRSVYIEWYDAGGNLITTINPTPNTSADLYVGFTRNSTNLITDPSSSSALAGGTWTNSSAIDTPVASSGVAYWSTRNDSSGRQMVTNYGQANVSVGLTFMTGPPIGTEHGLCLRWSSATNFWSASRTRLAKVVSGTLTTVASWSSLPDGSRIYVSMSGSTITVYQYQGPGLAPIQLATVTDSFNAAATRHGIFERSY